MRVDDVDAAAGRAEEPEGRIVAPAFDIPEVGRMAVVADPQGAALSLFTPTGEWEPTGGVFVWDELMTTDVEDAKRFYGEVVGWGAATRTWASSPTPSSPRAAPIVQGA